MSGIESGDVVEVEGEQMTVESVDDHNNRIHFQNGYEIHGAALHSDNVQLQ